MIIVTESKNAFVVAGKNNTFIVQKITQSEIDSYSYRVVWSSGNPNEWSITLGTRHSMEAAQELLQTIQGHLWAGTERYTVPSEESVAQS